MKEENNKELAKEWFKRAEDDERAIKNLLKEGGPFSIICFLSQQMAEKYLKGYLVFNRKKFKKIHDLGKILELCKEIDKSFSKITEDCDFLTRYYIASRYPGDFFEGISDKEAKSAYRKAEKIKEFILNKLKL
jgi:HEPN domain-containing protein